MEKFRKSLSLRKKKEKPQEEDPNTKPISWQEDERKVREGCCSFQVKYLGHIEVFDSRGMQVCEEAIKALRKPKKKAVRAILYVSGDTIRVSDEISKGLIVDQTIEKVSFCSPDRNHKKGFAYICRDGTTRRWMCHAFLAVKESGERLSHAVGCAFAICLEKKQKRDRETNQQNSSTSGENSTPVTKASSFRQTSLSERLQDPQSAIILEPVSTTVSLAQSPPHPPAISPTCPANSKISSAVPRPHASASFFSDRQTSLRMFPKLQESSPFKRDLSLRLSEMSSPPNSNGGSAWLNSTSPTVATNENKVDWPITDSIATIAQQHHSMTTDCQLSTANDSPAHSFGGPIDNLSVNQPMTSSYSGNRPMNYSSYSSSCDSPIPSFNNNPFLSNVTGIVNYGASSRISSQEAIDKQESPYNSSTSPRPTNGEKNLFSCEGNNKLSHHLSQQTSPLLSSVSRGDYQNESPLVNQSINGFNYNSTGQREMSSTNPWNNSESIVPSSTLNRQQQQQQQQPNSTTIDPFDISWINNSTNSISINNSTSPCFTNPFM